MEIININRYPGINICSKFLGKYIGGFEYQYNCFGVLCTHCIIHEIPKLYMGIEVIYENN